MEAEITVESASRSKIGTPSNKINVENIEGYRFIDAELLISVQNNMFTTGWTQRV